MDHFAHNTSVDGLTGQSSMGNPAAFNSDPIEPHSESEMSEQRLIDLSQDAIVETPADNATENPSTVKLIPEQRVREEHLEWLQPIIVDDGNLSYVPASRVDLDGKLSKIVDAQGVVYDGILLEDGGVAQAVFETNNADTFERFIAARHLREVAKRGVWRSALELTLLEDQQTWELFGAFYDPDFSPRAVVYALNTASELATWLLRPPEYQTVTFLETEHFAVSLPTDLVDHIQRMTDLENNRTTREWIIECLSKHSQYERPIVSSVEEEQSETSLAEEIRRRCSSGSMEAVRNLRESYCRRQDSNPNKS